MADLNVAVVIAGKDNASRQIKGVENSLSALNRTAGTVGKTLAIGVAGAAAGLAVGLGAAVSAAAGFEKTMSGVKAVSGATGEEMTALSGLALQLGKDTSFSASEAGRGLEELVKGGVTIPDIMDGAAKSTLALAAAGGVDLVSAAEIASNALNTFGLSGKDMAGVADLIAGAANASSIDVNDFRLSLAASGAVAAAVGLPFEDLAVGIAAMGNAGIKGSDAGTSLKTMLLNLQPATKEQGALFRELGLITEDGANQFFTAEGKAKGLAEISQTLQDALRGQTDQQKLATLETMFGSDAIRAAAVFSKLGAEGFDSLAGSMGKVTAEAVAAERLNNLAGDMEQLKGSAETAAIQLGQAFQPALRGATQAATAFINEGLIPFIEQNGPAFAEAITNAGAQVATFAGDLKTGALEGLGQLKTGLAETQVAWAPWAAEAGPAGLAVTSALSGAQSATDAFTLLLQGDFKGAIDSATVSMDQFAAAGRNAGEAIAKTEQYQATQQAWVDLGTAAETASPIVEALGRNFAISGEGSDGARVGAEALRIVVDALPNPLQDLADKLTAGAQSARETGDALNVVGQTLDAQQGPIATFKASFVEALTSGQTVNGAFSTAVQAEWPLIEAAITTAAANAQASVQTAWSDVQSQTDTAWAAVQAKTLEVWNQIPVDIQADLAIVGGALATKTAEFLATTDAWLATTSANASTTWSEVSSTVGTYAGEIAATIAARWGEASASTSSEWSGVSSTIGTQMAAASAEVSRIGGVIGATLGSLAAEALSQAGAIGSNIVAGITAGINAGIGSVTSAAAGLARSALSAAKAALGVESPSREFAAIGAYAVEGFAEGWQDAASTVAGTVDNTMAAVLSMADGSAVAAPSVGGWSAATDALTAYTVAVSDVTYPLTLLGQTVALTAGQTAAATAQSNAWTAALTLSNAAVVDLVRVVQDGLVPELVNTLAATNSLTGNEEGGLVYATASVVQLTTASLQLSDLLPTLTDQVATYTVTLGEQAAMLARTTAGVRKYIEALNDIPTEISTTVSVNYESSGSIPGYAHGTSYHPGGLAIVGERGPELLSLPRGSQVSPNVPARGRGLADGIDYDRLAAAFAGMSVVVDGERIGRVVRTSDRRHATANLPAGVGGF